MTIHLPKINGVGGGAGGGGGDGKFPIIVTDSGSSLPVASGYQIGDTFLNTSDKKIYKAEANSYELNTNAQIITYSGTTPLTLNNVSGVANGFVMLYRNGSYSWTYLERAFATNTVDWKGEREYKVHFKKTSQGTNDAYYILFAISQTYQYSTSKTVSFVIKNSKLYINETESGMGGVSQLVAPTLLVDYELEVDKEYYVSFLKKTDGKVETKIYEGGYEQTLVASNTIDTQIEDITTSYGSDPVSIEYGAYWRGTNNNYGYGFNGDIYLLDSTGDFLKASSELNWDSGADLTDKTEYADKTNGILYLYENEELNAIPNLEDYKKKAETITIDTASVTIANVQANKNYVFSNSAITDITLSGCETSFEETSINFTTGSSAPTFTDNASIKWFGGVPEMKANTTYTIVIFNKQAYWQEQENV